MNSINPLDHAQRLRQQADVTLHQIGLAGIVRPYGEAIPTGSYFLDVMVYPDIDIYIPMVSLDQLFGMASQFARCDRITQIVFEKSTDPSMPGGLYLKLRLDRSDWGRPWKIDLWSIDPSTIEAKMEPMRRFKLHMTESLREQIIRYKLSILTVQGRTPMYSGYYIYKAFLDEGLTEFAQVTRYLTANGIHIQ